MEQKRVLWIVAAVGLFLLVVIGTALWISSPSSKMQPALNTLQNSGNSWSRNDSQLQPAGSNVIIADTSAGQNGITNIDFTSTGNGQTQAPVNLNNLDSTAPAASSTPSDSAAAQSSAPAAQTAPSSTDNRTSSAGLAQTAVTLNVNITPSSSNATAYNETSQQAAPAPSVQQTVQPAPVSAAPAETKPATTAPATTNTKPATSATPAPAATASNTTSTPAKSSASSVKTVPVSQPDQFWVQVASFTGKKNAEDARAALAEQKIIGEVFTYQDSKGTIYYRLRVGPYKTKSEAEYWHKIIKEVEQFKGTDSYVVNSTVR
ncbi:MAG: SPOR domain-containing protein [Spirochaetaceae bacterium]|nr:SPOR domain-containing protein [Spirochaetaceae bacterium]